MNFPRLPWYLKGMSCLCLCFSTPSLVVGHFNSPPSNSLLPWVTERRTFSGGTPGRWEMFSVWRLLSKAAWFSTLFRAEGQMDGMMECRLMSKLKKQIKFETDWVWLILISQTDRNYFFFQKSCRTRDFSTFFSTFQLDPTVIRSSVSHPFKISCFHVFHVFHVSRLLFAPRSLWEVHCRLSRVPSRVSWLEPEPPEPPLMGSKVPCYDVSWYFNCFRPFFDMNI